MSKQDEPESCLGKNTANKYEGYEVTINIAHIKKFTSKITLEQKLYLSTIFNNTINSIVKDHKVSLIDKQFRFEFTKTGIVHLHGLFKITPSQSIPAVIQDYCRYFYKITNKRFGTDMKYDQYHYNNNMYYYRAPAINVSYEDTLEREADWLTYINKNQIK